jgi:dCTP deaminase
VLLSDHDLRGELDAGGLAIDPLDLTLIQPASIDVRLGRLFRVFNNHTATHIDPAVSVGGLTTLIRAGAEGFPLHPGEFVLAATVERVRVGTHLAARLEGKSSLGRLGLVVHATAGFIDPGFDGHITLELSSVATLPIRLHVGMKIGQLCVMRLSSPAVRPYGTDGLKSRYQGQQGPTESRSWTDFPPA